MVASVTEAMTPARAGVGIRETRREGDELVVVGNCDCGENGALDDACSEELVMGRFADECEVTSGELNTSVSDFEEDADGEVEVVDGLICFPRVHMTSIPSLTVQPAAIVSSDSSDGMFFVWLRRWGGNPLGIAATMCCLSCYGED